MPPNGRDELCGLEFEKKLSGPPPSRARAGSRTLPKIIQNLFEFTQEEVCVPMTTLCLWVTLRMHCCG